MNEAVHGQTQRIWVQVVESVLSSLWPRVHNYRICTNYCFFHITQLTYFLLSKASPLPIPPTMPTFFMFTRVTLHLAYSVFAYFCVRLFCICLFCIRLFCVCLFRIRLPCVGLFRVRLPCVGLFRVRLFLDIFVLAYSVFAYSVLAYIEFAYFVFAITRIIFSSAN